MPEADRTLGVLIETCDTALTVPSSGDVESTVILNLSDDGGDNFRVRAFAVVDDVAMTGDTSGTWTMWRKRVLWVHSMQTEDGAGSFYPASPQPNLSQIQADLHTAYANANPEKACYLDIVAGPGEPPMPYRDHLYTHNETGQFAWMGYAWTNLHLAAGSSAHTPSWFNVIGVRHLWEVLNPERLIGGKSVQGLPDMAVAAGWAVQANVSRSMLTIHELGHLLTGQSNTENHQRHALGDEDPSCAFESGEGGNREAIRICERHCRDVRNRVTREWSDHVIADPQRTCILDSQ